MPLPNMLWFSTIITMQMILLRVGDLWWDQTSSQPNFFNRYSVEHSILSTFLLLNIGIYMFQWRERIFIQNWDPNWIIFIIQACKKIILTSSQSFFGIWLHSYCSLPRSVGSNQALTTSHIAWNKIRTVISPCLVLWILFRIS